MNLYLAQLNDLLLKHLTPALWVNDRLYELDQLNGYRDVGFDFDVNDLTADEEWHYLDLSSIVGKHETLVRLYLQTATQAVGSVLQQPSGRLYLGSNQNNINNNVATKVLLDTVDPFFTDGIEDTSDNKITPGAAGYYSYFASVCWEVILDQKRYEAFVIREPGAVQINRHSFCNSGSGLGTAGQTFNKIADITYLTDVQYLELWVRHSDGTNNPDLIAGTNFTSLSLQAIRAASGSVSGSIQFRTYGHTNESAYCLAGSNQHICVKTDANGVIEYKITGSPSTLNLKVLGWRPVYVIGG